jgi:hypothetical protein
MIRERGKGWVRSQIIRPTERLALYTVNNTILSEDKPWLAGSPYGLKTNFLINKIMRKTVSQLLAY